MIDLFNAQQVTVRGFGLAIYIILYVVYLVHLVMSTSKETKLIQRYSGKKNAVGWKQMLLAVAGGVIALLMFVFYLKYV